MSRRNLDEVMNNLEPTKLHCCSYGCINIVLTVIFSATLLVVNSTPFRVYFIWGTQANSALASARSRQYSGSKREHYSKEIGPPYQLHTARLYICGFAIKTHFTKIQSFIKLLRIDTWAVWPYGLRELSNHVCSTTTFQEKVYDFRSILRYSSESTKLVNFLPICKHLASFLHV